MTERAQFACGKNQITMQSFGIWHWDGGIKKFRSYWADSMGWGQGTCRYDEEDKAWHMKGESHDGGPTGNWHGTLRLVDKNTMEWELKETDALGLMTFMEMKGTMKRK